MIIFADSSVIGRVYLDDSDDSDRLRQAVFDGDQPVAVSQLTDVEFAHTVALARHERRLSTKRADELITQYAYDTSDDGALAVIVIDARTFGVARELACAHPTLRSLDALQLASCAGLMAQVAEPVALLTRDARQRDIAKRAGIALSSI
ncbi:MAG: type II toxin-antitoxin system VapC family toxin [Actinomycetia bacterium]|nr:type II toxin-antitoxin system VapC family toxin [Actinomycetes bacterium]